MRRLPRIALLLVALAVVMPLLGGCADFDPDSLDPFGLNKKKPLPGQRELLFPEGVPGVTQGIPPEYRAGYKPPGSEDFTLDGSAGQPTATSVPRTAASAPTTPVRQSRLSKPAQAPKPAARPKPRVAKPKPKPKPKVTETASKPQDPQSPWPSTPQQTTTRPGTSAPWPSTQPQSSRPRSTQAGWPSEQGTQEQKLAPWPSAPPSGTFSRQ